MFNGKSILITGGTGSFGEECVRMILAHYSPRKIIIFSRGELKQYQMRQKFYCSNIHYMLGDVRDAQRLRQAMRGVDYVIHAAALKHVETCESNPMECIKTNVIGAQNVIDAAIENKVHKVIALSTDKVVNPISLYGAAKLAADKLFIAANHIDGHNTQFSIVRYGNVAGSSGSIVPYFQKLIRERSPFLPITDARMTRFWLTLERGIQFVFLCFMRMQGGEIFIPKIPSIRIVDLATAFAPDLPHKIIGIRAGEKLHELMCSQDEIRQTIKFSDHYVIQPAMTPKNNLNYFINLLSEKGVLIQNSLELHSNTNPNFLSIDEITMLNNHVGVT